LVTKEANNLPAFAEVSCGRDTVFRDIDFGDSAKREEQFDQILRWIFGGLAQDVADGGGYGRVEKDVSRLQSGEIHAHRLSRLKRSHNAPRIRFSASRPPIAIQLEQFAKFLRSAGCSPAIFQPSPICKKVGGTPALLKSAQMRAETSWKLSG
jgi:hypothetical protein